MNKNELIKELKKTNYNDYVVLRDSAVFGFKYWICPDRETAIKTYNTINSEHFKPCTIEIIGLF